MLKISLQMQYNINTCELSQINCVKTDMLFCFGFFFWSTISPNCAQVKCLHTKQLMLQCTCDDTLSMFRAEKQTLVFHCRALCSLHDTRPLLHSYGSSR